MTQILFVCTANRYRSVIAEACFKEELSKRRQEIGWVVLSAGTWTTNGMPAMPEAIKRAAELKLDIQNHRSTVITENMLKEANLVLVMEGGQKEALQVEFDQYKNKIYLLTEASQGLAYDIPDPVMGVVNDDVAFEISKLIQNGFDGICALARK